MVLRVHETANARAAKLLQLLLQQNEVVIINEATATSSHQRHVLRNRCEMQTLHPDTTCKRAK